MPIVGKPKTTPAAGSAILSPDKVIVSPAVGSLHGMSVINYADVERIAVSGGNRWVPVFADNAVFWDNPVAVTVVRKGGSTDSFAAGEIGFLQVFGGKVAAAGPRVIRRLPGREASSPKLGVRSRYRAGLDVLSGLVDLSQSPARYRGAWDKFNTYAPGETVYYAGAYWQAQEEITPPWFPTFSDGEVPGRSGSWRLAPSTVLGVDGYTDSDTVKRVQRALIDRKGSLDKPTQTAVDAMIKAGKNGGIDGIFGSKTQAAVASFNRAMAGGREVGDGPNITDNTLRALSLSTPIDYGTPPPVAKAPPPPRPAPGPGPVYSPPTLAVPTPGAEVGGVPLWQIGLGILASGAAAYGAYRIARRK